MMAARILSFFRLIVVKVPFPRFKILKTTNEINSYDNLNSANCYYLRCIWEPRYIEIVKSAETRISN